MKKVPPPRLSVNLATSTWHQLASDCRIPPGKGNESGKFKMFHAFLFKKCKDDHKKYRLGLKYLSFYKIMTQYVDSRFSVSYHT